MSPVDIAVIGAGPAGVAAAITAARRGRSVIVLDKAVFPRDKCCGDGLTAACLRELEQLGLRTVDVKSWQPVRDVVLHSPAGRRIELPLPRDTGLHSVVARRLDLDDALVRLARQAGAEVREASPIEALSGTDDGLVELRSGGQPVRARMVVAADGMWSATRKLCGAPHTGRYRGEWHAFRQYFRGGSSDALGAQHIWFPAQLLPGYIWSFPVAGGGLNVGFGFLRDGRHAVGDGTALWREVLRRPDLREVLGPDLVADGPMRAWPIPARVDRAPLSALGGRVLFVGDAAAAADPMTGEGIGQALLSGRLAAMAIDEALAAPTGPDPAHTAVRAAAGYRRAIHHDLVADHRLARALGGLLASPRTTEWALRSVDLNGWTRRNFARWMFEDYPRAVLLTARRWRRGQFHPRGAFATTARPCG